MKAFLVGRRPRTWVIAGAIVAVLAAASIYWFGFAMPAQAAGATATSRTVAVSEQTLQRTVSGTGTLTPTVDESVNFGASGTVTAVDVKAGSTVTAGQVLGTVDTLTVNANLLSAQATLASAQAKLSTATSGSDGSAADVAQIAADQAQVDVAQAAVTTAQTAANSTTLTSPVAGLVTAVNVAVGDSVTSATSTNSSSGSSTSSGTGSSSGGSTSSGTAGGTSGSAATGAGTSSSGTTSGSSTSSSSTSSSSPAFEIVGTTSWNLSVSVSATSVKSVKVGQQVQLSTDENSSFFGTVSSIGLLPSTSSGAATYPVTVDVTGSPADLYDGVSVTAEIVYERIANALTVPSFAVTTQNGKSTVTKVVDGKNVVTTVTVGETVGQVTQITKGLSSGDKVLVRIASPLGTSGSGTQTGTRTGTGTGGFPGGEGGFSGGEGGFSGRTGGTGETGGTGGGTGGRTGSTNNG